jgi:hypothetical protein
MSSPTEARRRTGPTAATLAGVALAATLAAGLASGCSDSASAGSGGRPDPAGSATRQPAALSGGACQLLDYDTVEAALGVRFAVAASATSGATFTCVLQPDGAGEPDLSLAVTATEADQSVFRTSVVPKGAAVIQDLGKVGYQLGVPAGGGAGPGLEVGWLSGNQRLMVLRYRTAGDAAGTDVNALLPKLVELARKIDLTTV